jgi:hypothetical protein
LVWLELKLGTSIGEASARIYENLDARMQIQVFTKEFGTPDNQWYIVQVNEINESGESENPLYVLWTNSMLEDQIENGFQ